MSEKNRHDNGVGESIAAGNASWTFEGEVAKSFSSHVKRSVPLYEEGHNLILQISDYFLKKNGLLYDMGPSTGTLLEKLAHRHREKNIRFVGIDSVTEMINEARDRLSAFENIELLVDDICLFDYEHSDMIVSYYTIQFVSPHVRQMLFDKIYQSLKWGGAFVMFEKVRAPDARFQDMCTGIYTDFKLEQGYTADEIVNKARSLKSVLEPFSTQGNLDLLKRAGFVDVMTIMKYVSFEGFLAIK